MMLDEIVFSWYQVERGPRTFEIHSHREQLFTITYKQTTGNEVANNNFQELTTMTNARLWLRSIQWTIHPI